MTLSGGEKISTIPIAKSVISNLPFVGHAVVVGDGKPHLALLMTIRVKFKLLGLPKDTTIVLSARRRI